MSKRPGAAPAETAFRMAGSSSRRRHFPNTGSSPPCAPSPRRARIAPALCLLRRPPRLSEIQRFENVSVNIFKPLFETIRPVVGHISAPANLGNSPHAAIYRYTFDRQTALLLVPSTRRAAGPRTTRAHNSSSFLYHPTASIIHHHHHPCVIRNHPAPPSSSMCHPHVPSSNTHSPSSKL